MNKPPIIVISDCAGDEDGHGRIAAQVEYEFGRPATAIQYACCEVQAAGFLATHVGLARRRSAVIIANVAPRNGTAQKRFRNGSPFGWFRLDRTLVVSTIDGLTPSLVNELEPGGVRFNCLDTEAVAREIFTDPREAQLVASSQFRSLEFQIPAAVRIANGEHLPTRSWPDQVPPMPPCAWNIDRFGNIKTSTHVDATRVELPQRIRVLVATAADDGEHELPCYPRLRDVPGDGKPAVVVGSTRYGYRCFLELVVQGGRAADNLAVGVGDMVVFHHNFD